MGDEIMCQRPPELPTDHIDRLAWRATYVIVVIVLSAIIWLGVVLVRWNNWNKEKDDYECHLETGEIFRP
jgi:hypothetical protein